MNSPKPNENPFDHIPTMHALYCRLTGQNIELHRFDRQRQWYEILRAGFTAQDLERVVKYLQREILHKRRNPGALKLSNLLQPDRFEEDLNLSRVRLESPRTKAAPPQETSEPVSEETRRQQCESLRAFRLSLQNHGPGPSGSTEQSAPRSKTPPFKLK